MHFQYLLLITSENTQLDPHSPEPYMESSGSFQEVVRKFCVVLSQVGVTGKNTLVPAIRH